MAEGRFAIRRRIKSERAREAELLIILAALLIFKAANHLLCQRPIVGASSRYSVRMTGNALELRGELIHTGDQRGDVL